MKKVLKYLWVVVVFVDVFTGVLYARKHVSAPPPNTTQYKEYKTGAVKNCNVDIKAIYADGLSVNAYGLGSKGFVGGGADIYKIYSSGACTKVVHMPTGIYEPFAVDSKRKFIYHIVRNGEPYFLEKYNFSGKLITSTKISIMTSSDDSHIVIGTEGSVYVVDSANARINKFSASGKYLLAWGGKGDGDGQFQDIKSIAVDKENKIYVLDRTKNRVQKFDSRGNFITKWGEKPTADHGIYELDDPRFVGVDNNLNVYVSSNGNLKKFHNDGDYIGTIRPKINGSFWLKKMDAAGNSYASKIIVNKNYHLVGGIGIDGRKYTRGEHASIQSMVFDSQNNMYTIDGEKSAIQKFSKSGKYIRQWGEYGDGKGRFVHRKLDLAINNFDEIYVLDTYQLLEFYNPNHITAKIQKFTTNGKLLQTLSFSKTNMDSIAVDKNNQLYVVESKDTGDSEAASIISTPIVNVYDRGGKKLRTFQFPSYRYISAIHNRPQIDIDKKRNLLYLKVDHRTVKELKTTILKCTLAGKILRTWEGVPFYSHQFVFKNGNLGYANGDYLYIYSNSGLFIRKEKQYTNISLAEEDKFGSVYTVHNLGNGEYHTSAKIYKKSVNPDIDHDGVVNEKDAFPFNSHEWLDTDHDGIGNNADKDDDNDGLSDTVEKAHKLNPLKASDAQADFDHDGFSNAVEINAGTNIRSAKSRPIWTPVMMGDLITFVPASK